MKLMLSRPKSPPNLKTALWDCGIFRFFCILHLSRKQTLIIISYVSGPASSSRTWLRSCVLLPVRERRDLAGPPSGRCGRSGQTQCTAASTPPGFRSLVSNVPGPHSTSHPSKPQPHRHTHFICFHHSRCGGCRPKWTNTRSSLTGSVFVHR